MQPKLEGVHGSFPVAGSQRGLVILCPSQCWIQVASNHLQDDVGDVRVSFTAGAPAISQNAPKPPQQSQLWVGRLAIVRAESGHIGSSELTCSRTACMAVYGFFSAAALLMPASCTKVSPTVKLPC